MRRRGSGSLGRGLKFGIGMAAGRSMVDGITGRNAQRRGNRQGQAVQNTVEVVKVRCKACNGLNDETVNFCGACGEKM